MKKLMLLALILILACSTKKTNVSEDKGIGDTRTKQVEFIDKNTYLLTEMSEDTTYGYDKSNPIKVGGVHDKDGAMNEQRFLNALFGPNNKKMMYYRAGSCCAFKTPNGFIENMGMLDRFRLSEIGSKDTIDIYINMYDAGDLKIPFGLKAQVKK